MEIRIGKLFPLNYNLFFFFSSWDFPGVSGGKNYPAMQKTQIRSLSWEDPLEKGMATHSSILAWEVPWKPGRLQSMGLQRDRHNLVINTFTFHNKVWTKNTYSMVLFPWNSL